MSGSRIPWSDAPVVRPVRSWALRKRTHRRLAQTWGVPVEVLAVAMSLPGRYVFRTCRPDGRPVFVKARNWRGALDREVEALRTMAPSGVVPVLTDDLPGVPHIVATGLVEGQPLGDCDGDGAWIAAGRALRRLHELDLTSAAIEAPDGRRWGAERARDIRAAIGRLVVRNVPHDPWVHALSEWAAEVLDRSGPVDPVLSHLDCTPRHVHVDSTGEARFLDLERFGAADRWVDIAVLTLDDPDRLPAVLDGYGMAGAGDPDLLDAYRVERLLSHLEFEADVRIPSGDTHRTFAALAAARPSIRGR